MKFLVSWDVHPDKRVEVMNMWSGLTPDERANVGDGVRLIGRWHNMAEYTGAAIVEADDASALALFAGQWNPVMDITIAPVLDDEEAAAAGKIVLSQLAGS
jgi:hypothetical protein